MEPMPMYTLDPTKQYTSVSERDLLEACGLIPIFTEDEEGTLKERLEAGYGAFFRRWDSAGFTLTKDGIYEYDDQDGDDEYKDPPLFPYITISWAGSSSKEKAHIYPYGIVCLTDDDGNKFMTRMD